jgi:hypothetical protein
LLGGPGTSRALDRGGGRAGCELPTVRGYAGGTRPTTRGW